MNRLIGVILAGGQSSRMGQDKALMQYKGRPLIEHMAALLLATGAADILISGRTHPGFASVPDQHANQGPGAALVGLLPHLDTTAALVTAVDTPLLTPKLLRGLIGSRACHYTRQPLPLYVPAGSELPGNASQLHSIRDVICALGGISIPAPPDSQPCFTNLNAPEDWNDLP